MFKRTLGQHALAAALALTVALAAGLGAWHGLALRTGPAPDAATGVYIHNLGNTLQDQTRNLSRLSQALRTGDRLVVMGSSELTSTDLRFVPYRFLADELRMPVMAYGHSGFQSLGMQLVLAALADDLSPASRVVIMVSPGWFDGDGGLGPDEFREHANPLLPRLVRQPEGREQLARWLRDKGDARVAWSMAAEQAYVFRQRLVDLWTPAHAAPAPETEAAGPAAA
ncbi:D-alanyl-lipoteichoic acid biosynthesis protein DltD, partial [Achromobacter xylosoxidans]